MKLLNQGLIITLSLLCSANLFADTAQNGNNLNQTSTISTGSTARSTIQNPPSTIQNPPSTIQNPPSSVQSPPANMPSVSTMVAPNPIPAPSAEQPPASTYNSNVNVSADATVSGTTNNQ